MAADARHMVVGRLRKPHGLKGDLRLFPITDDPQTVFAPGRSVWLVGLDGEIVVAGLDSAVEVRRDRWGVPHIYAHTTHDLFFAQGYSSARMEASAASY